MSGRMFLLVFGVFVVGVGELRAGMTHRYSFNESGGAGTILVDSVGGANASIVDVGVNDATVSGGKVRMAGGTKTVADYVALPALLTGLSDATIELWATPRSLQNWARIIDFGSSMENNLMMSWTRGTDINTDRVAFKIVTENYLDSAMKPYVLNEPVHLAMVVDDDGGPSGETQVRIYKNGQYRGALNTAFNLSQLVETANTLGRSQYGDATANATYDEVRVYDYALTPLELAASRLVGPNQVITNNVFLAERGNLRYHPVNLGLALAAAKINYNQPLLRGGDQRLGGVPFSIVEDAAGNEGWNAQTDGGNGSDVRSLAIPVGLYGVIEVHALMGTFWGDTGTNTLASLIFADTDGNTLRVELDGNSELRDYQQGSFANTINGTTTTQVLNDGNVGRLDKTRVILPDVWATRTLASVTLEDRGQNGVQRCYIVGLTVATLPIVDAAAADLALGNGALVGAWTNYGSLADFTQPDDNYKPVYATSVAGAPAITFDGTDNRLETFGTYAPTNVTGNSDWTVEAWAYDPAIGDQECLVNWAIRGGPDGTLAQLMYGVNAVWGAAGHWGWYDMGYDGGVPAAGEWHHIVLTYPGAGGTEKVYVDGVLNAFENKTLNLHGLQYAPALNVILGAALNNNYTFNAPSYFSGSLGAVRMYDRQLTAAEVVGKYNEDAASYGYAALTEYAAAGTVLVDLDARELALSDGAAVTRWVNKGTLADFTQGTAGNQPKYYVNVGGVPAVTFDGADDRMEANTAPLEITGNSDYTVEAWVLNPVIQEEECVINWARGGTALKAAQLNYGYSALFGAATHWTTPGDMGFDGGVPAAGEWHHLVLTYPGGNGPERVFVDGVLCAFENKTLVLHGPGDGATMNVALGSRYDGASWNKPLSGSIAAIRVYDGMLSPGQVLEHYNEDAAYYGRDPEPGVEGNPIWNAVAYWQFEDVNDENALPQNSAFTVNGGFTVGNAIDAQWIRAENGDGFAAAEGAAPSYGTRVLGAIGTQETHIYRSVTVFARVRMSAFNGIDDIMRVGATSSAAADYFGLELNNGQPRFVVKPANGNEVNVGHAATLATDKWYDVTGVFDSTGGTIAVYVADPFTCEAVGTEASLAVGFNALDISGSANILFLEAPGNANGDNVGGMLEVAAIWDRALTAAEVARLTAPRPSSGTVFSIR